MAIERHDDGGIVYRLDDQDLTLRLAPDLVIVEKESIITHLPFPSRVARVLSVMYVGEPAGQESQEAVEAQWGLVSLQGMVDELQAFGLDAIAGARLYHGEQSRVAIVGEPIQQHILQMPDYELATSPKAKVLGYEKVGESYLPHQNSRLMRKLTAEELAEVLKEWKIEMLQSGSFGKLGQDIPRSLAGAQRITQGDKLNDYIIPLLMGRDPLLNPQPQPTRPVSFEDIDWRRIEDERYTSTLMERARRERELSPKHPPSGLRKDFPIKGSPLQKIGKIEQGPYRHFRDFDDPFEAVRNRERDVPNEIQPTFTNPCEPNRGDDKQELDPKGYLEVLLRRLNKSKGDEDSGDHALNNDAFWERIKRRNKI